jgi:cbb3-type cytochrome oxidase maturation protein
MDISVYFIPISIIFGFIILCALVWAIRSGQYDDLDGAATRILYDEPEQNKKREEQ